MVSCLRVYNSLSKTVVSFSEIIYRNGKVSDKPLSWYVCGPTVYDESHIGHGWTYVKFDLIRRVLEQRYKVRVDYALGMTDIDDKIIARAQLTNQRPLDLARKYEATFLRDMDSLNVQRPTRILRVSEHIPEIIEYVQTLIHNKSAYVGELTRSVYFDVKSMGNTYGQLCHHPSSELNENNLIGGNDAPYATTSKGEKKDPRDFALWKVYPSTTKLGDGWTSPWGDGRPGWHIECSAMSNSVFGNTLDVHSGGIDLIFPHHENELAQCLAYHKSDSWVKLFIHSGHLHIAGHKMSKSLKNFTTITDYMSNSHSKNHLRYICLLTKYNQTAELTPALVKLALTTEARLRSLVALVGNMVISSNDINSTTNAVKKWNPADHLLYAQLLTAQTKIDHSFDNDFNFPEVMNSLTRLAKLTTNYINKNDNSQPLKLDLVLQISDYICLELSTLGINIRPENITEVHTDHSNLPLSSQLNYQSILNEYRENIRQLLVSAKMNDSTTKEKLIASLFSESDRVRNIVSGVDANKPRG